MKRRLLAAALLAALCGSPLGAQTSKLYQYTVTLKLEAGEQRVAVAVQDQVSASTSYLSRSVKVGRGLASNGR